jgi:hypothetical protein
VEHYIVVTVVPDPLEPQSLHRLLLDRMLNSPPASLSQRSRHP